MTKRQAECLKEAKRRGSLIHGGPKDSGIPYWLIRECVLKGWLSAVVVVRGAKGNVIEYVLTNEKA